jgi:hypothetical protein
VDAIQFSQQPDAAYCELPQVLGPGGRAVLTCSEPSARATNGCPAACERAMWQEAAALDPGDDLALQSFHDEGMRFLEILDLLLSRVIVTATATVDAPSMR